MPSSSRDFFFFFLIQTIFKVFIEFVTILLPFHGLFVFRVFFFFWFYGPEACKILAQQPRIEPTPPVLECKVLTTGLSGKSQEGISKLHLASTLATQRRKDLRRMVLCGNVTISSLNTQSMAKPTQSMPYMLQNGFQLWIQHDEVETASYRGWDVGFWASRATARKSYPLSEPTFPHL